MRLWNHNEDYGKCTCSQLAVNNGTHDLYVKFGFHPLWLVVIFLSWPGAILIYATLWTILKFGASRQRDKELNSPKEMPNYLDC